MILIAASAWMAACTPVAALPPAAPMSARTATPIRSTVSPIASPKPRSTPQSIESAIAQVTRAFQADDATSLQALLLDQVYLAQGPDAGIGSLIGRETVLKWLNRRWAAQLSIVSNNYVEHFVMIEIVTQGWSAVAPMQTDRLTFHLHRYNAQGLGDALNGLWRIDAILYQ